MLLLLLLIGLASPVLFPSIELAINGIEGDIMKSFGFGMILFIFSCLVFVYFSVDKKDS